VGPVAYGSLPISSHTLTGSLVILLGHRRCAGIRQQFGLAIVTALVWGALQPAFVRAETTIIPSAFGSGRYDSNIFLAPASRLAPGTQPSDFAGTVGGYAQLLHRSRDVEGSLTAGGDFNFYAVNTDRNFTRVRVNGYVILDRWVERLAKGAKLTVTEFFRYTPETPGFLTGAPDDPFLRGIQTFRANTFLNTTSVNASYPLFKALAVLGSYTFSTRRVPSSQTPTTTGVNFFDSFLNTWSAGPQYQLTPVDSIALLYRQGLLDQERSGGSGVRTIETNTQSILIDYTRVMPNWRFELAGGAVLVEPASEWFGIGRIRISNNPERATTVELSLSRQAAPSFFNIPGAVISNVGQVTLNHRLSERLSLRGSVRYAYNQQAINTSVTFENLNARAGLDYKLTRNIVASLFYTYTYINNGFALPEYQVSRNQVGFSMTAQWKDVGIQLEE
jgi:hypothetical protein